MKIWYTNIFYIGTIIRFFFNKPFCIFNIFYVDFIWIISIAAFHTSEFLYKPNSSNLLPCDFDVCSIVVFNTVCVIMAKKWYKCNENIFICLVLNRLSCTHQI